MGMFYCVGSGLWFSGSRGRRNPRNLVMAAEPTKSWEQPGQSTCTSIYSYGYVAHTDTYVHRLFPRRGWGVEWRAHSLLIPSPSTLLSPSPPLLFAKLHFQKRVLTSSGLSYHWIRVGVQVNPFYIVKPVPL